MKKILPIIILLITLSLIGLIYLQFTWFQNLLKVKQDQLWEIGNAAVRTVGIDLSESNSRTPFLKNQQNTFGLNNGLSSFELLRATTIAQRYTQYEIQEKLEAAFQKNFTKKIPFEFGLANSMEIISFEMQSSYFQKMLGDTINNKQYVFPIEPSGGSYAEGLVPYETLIVIIPGFKEIVFKSSYKELVGSLVLTCLIMFAFFFTVRALINQKKLSEIKSDFINNMTHEFKTPLATISLAVDALKNEKVINDREKLSYFSGIIKEENKRLNKHVETILQAALLEKQEFQLDNKPMHANELIHTSLANFKLQLQDKQATVKLFLDAKNDLISVDQNHFVNLLNNLIDNAIKYSKENLELQITTASTQKNMTIKIEDNGIGMNRESLKRVFEKFYRAHTGNVHNVKGFGLGMSYVKTIIDAHKGNIKVESTLGKGTTFIVEMPLIEVMNDGM
jgi:two-component system, OmpR family, phosphate regulon sensor histidine kinase PhoR